MCAAKFIADSSLHGILAGVEVRTREVPGKGERHVLDEGPGAGFLPHNDEEERIPQTAPIPVGDNADYIEWLRRASFQVVEEAKGGQAAPPPTPPEIERPPYGTPGPE
jgi:hypothetical protein